MREFEEEGAEKERGEVEKKSYKRKERRGGEGLKEIWNNSNARSVNDYRD